MPNGDPREGFFYPTPTLMVDSFNLESHFLYVQDNTCTQNAQTYVQTKPTKYLSVLERILNILGAELHLNFTFCLIECYSF